MTLLPSDVWTDAGATWPVFVVSRETEELRFLSNYDPVTRANFVTEHETLTQIHLACSVCDQSVFCLHPGGADGYRVTIADLLAGILSHIRRSHPDVVAS
jgi:hypothetical protein